MRCLVVLKLKKIENNIKKIKNKNIILRFLVFSLALYLFALVFNLLLMPANIVSGGTNGLAILIHEIFKIDSSLIVTIIYITMLFLSFVFLDIESTLSLIATTILYPLFVNLTANISNFIVIDYSNMILISIFAGILNGIISGIILKIGFNPGGLIVIAQIIYKYFRISVSKSNTIISFIIVILAGYFIGLNSILYAIIVIYLTNIFTDKMLLGISDNKLFYIITDKESEVKAFIMRYLTHGVTLINCEAAYTKTKKHALMCAIPTKQYYILKEGIKEIDEQAFFVVTDAYQVLGGI